MGVQVPDNRRLADPPLMRLESEGGHAYLSMLLQLSASQTEVQQQADVEARLVTLGLATLQRFQVGHPAQHLPQHQLPSTLKSMLPESCSRPTLQISFCRQRCNMSMGSSDISIYSI